MAEDLDTLLSIAEIAGVFVGFAALLTVVSRSAEVNVRAGDSFLLATVVLSSVVVIGAALVPVVLSRYGVVESTVWRASASVLLVTNWVQILYVGRTTLRYREAHQRRPGLGFVIGTLEIVLQASLLVCVLGVWKNLSSALYVTAPAVALIQAGIMFAILVVNLLTAEDE